MNLIKIWIKPCTRNYLSAATILLLSLGCGNNKIKLAKAKADQLWKDVATGTAEKDFPEKHFPRTANFYAILADLKDKCDFKNRKGGLTGQRYQKDVTTALEKVIFVFDYYMPCDTLKFTLTYDLQQSVELYEFRIDPI